jgi:UDP-GlcNAc:undecaprenyl-phosphate/decaprenyl-phosphate GlcNAc-1-phosphate transferase
MTYLLWFILPGVSAALMSLLLTPLVARLAVRVGAVDMPGERKVHTTPVPRLGGLAVVASIAMTFVGATFLSGGVWQLPSHLAWGLGLGVLPILFVSIADDIRSVPAQWKLAAHTAGALIAVGLGISLSPVVHLFGFPLQIGWIAGPLSVVWIVGVTNAFNIIDGLDGLSTGLAFISAVCMFSVFAVVGQPGMAGVCLVLAGALAGFLPYNVFPARLFLGDTGATAIGFCLAVFSLRGGSTLSSGFAALLPVFILGLPIADTLIAMLRRSLQRLERRGGGVFVADRNHIHHRLLDLGVDHSNAVLVLYAAGIVLAGAALLSVFATTREAAFLVMALLVAGLVGIQRLGYDEFAFIRRGTVLRVYELPAVKRGFFVVFVDLVLVLASAYVSIGLKIDHWRLSAVASSVLEIATTMAPITVLVFAWRDLYKGTWRVAGLHDFTKVAVAVFIATPIGALMLRMFSRSPYPLSFFVIYGLVTLLVTVTIRASYVILENSKFRSSREGTPILVYGAGRRGVAAVQELFQNQATRLRPVGFIDDDLYKLGRIVNGLRVLGSGRNLESLMESTGARGILLSTPQIAEERVARSAETCRALGAEVLRLDLGVRLLDGASFVPSPNTVDVQTVMQVVQDRDETFAAPGCQACPSCRKRVLYRSRARNTFERFKKVRTEKRLYRCDECGWRGWLTPLDFGETLAADRSATPNLVSLDYGIADGTIAAGMFDPAHLN